MCRYGRSKVEEEEEWGGGGTYELEVGPIRLTTVTQGTVEVALDHLYLGEHRVVSKEKRSLAVLAVESLEVCGAPPYPL